MLAAYTTLLVVSAALAVALAVAILGRRTERVARLLAGVLFVTAIWCLAYALQLSSTTPAAARFWNNVRLLGPTLVAPMLFLFAAAYTDRTAWLRPRRVVPLFAVAAVSNLLTWTNESHHLVRRGMVAVGDGGPYAGTVMGPWAAVYATYGFVLFGAAVYMFASMARRRGRVYRGQVATVLVAVLVPGLANMAFALDMTTLDLTPFAFALTGTMFALALYRYRLLDILPIARSTVFDSVDSGVLVVDADGTVVDTNERAAEILGVDRGAAVGTAVGALFAESLPGAEDALDERAGPTRVERECDGRRQWYEVEPSPITGTSDRAVGAST